VSVVPTFHSPTPSQHHKSKKKAKFIYFKIKQFFNVLKMVPSNPILATPGMMDPRGQTMSSTCSNIMAGKLELG
jgi:hypothetical protein